MTLKAVFCDVGGPIYDDENYVAAVLTALDELRADAGAGPVPGFDEGNGRPLGRHPGRDADQVVEEEGDEPDQERRAGGGRAVGKYGHGGPR